MMYPEGRTSPTQELQMISVLDANIHNIALAGTFDDCQNIVKASADESARRGCERTLPTRCERV